MRRMILPASLLLALSSFAMAAPIYKWVDAEGVTHFGAQPPQGAQATTVNTQTAPEALASPEPFCVDTLALEQWLQWIFLPRMK
ncbi:YqcC family protein, partial [Pseudomonas aeruginosa]|uniref:YqcC family protein n=1 Tax=Pseudomonas aeruginosa TaxID=287 RepID=UPI0021632759